MGQQLLTIKQLAQYVGVTVRAVRHYHALGLLPEPPRDRSGYRRYGADTVIQLTRIKILADAGVPLSRIETLTQMPSETFAATIASIKSDIAARIAELEETQRRLDALRYGDRMFTSEAIADYLDYLRHIGLSEELVSHERGAWILISALYPGYADTWATQKKSILAQPNWASLYLRLDEARHWPPTDARIALLAKDIIRISSGYTPTPIDRQDALTANTQAISLISGYGVDAFPAWRQLVAMIKELVSS